MLINVKILTLISRINSWSAEFNMNNPVNPYVLVTKTSFVSFGDEDVWDTCFRRLSAKLTSAGHLKNVLKTKCKRV